MFRARFNLKQLFVGLTVVSLAMAGFICPIYNHRQERAILAKLPVTPTIEYVDSGLYPTSYFL